MRPQPDILFWDVDTQVDFMRESGALYVPGAEDIIPNLGRLTEAARMAGVPVVASADDHEAGDAEISSDPDFSATYPPHCMRGTPGQEKIPQTRLPATVLIGHEALAPEALAHRVEEARDALVILKKQFDVFTNPNTEAILELLRPAEIVLYGVALDVCNRAAVEGLWSRGHHDLTLVTDATAALDEERGRELLAEWRERGIDMATTDEILARLPDVPFVPREDNLAQGAQA